MASICLSFSVKKNAGDGSVSLSPIFAVFNEMAADSDRDNFGWILVEFRYLGLVSFGLRANRIANWGMDRDMSLSQHVIGSGRIPRCSDDRKARVHMPEKGITSPFGVTFPPTEWRKYQPLRRHIEHRFSRLGPP